MMRHRIVCASKRLRTGIPEDTYQSHLGHDAKKTLIGSFSFSLSLILNLP
jgi:hypothetical protein